MSQQANQMKIRAESIAIRFFSGKLATNATTPRSIGKAKNSLNVSIQGPGLGIHFIAPGNNVMTKYGDAIPIPIPKKISSTTQAGWVSETARALPRNGPLQGVASNVVITPLKKAPP
jgi:hypothetical protein